MPGSNAGAGCRNCAMRAKLAYGSRATSRGREVRAASSGETMTADARVVSSCPRYRGLARNAIAPSPPFSSVPTCVMAMAPSPSSRRSKRRASSASVYEAARSVWFTDEGGREKRGRRRARLLVGQRLDHLVGDVDPLAREHHGILQDQVELLALGDLLDHLVGALLERREELVLAQVHVLAELALQACQVARAVREIALLVAPLGLAHRGAVLVERRLQVAHLLGDALDLRVARRELALELLLRPLGRCGFAEQALGVDEADLVVGRGRVGASERQRGNEDDEDAEHGFSLTRA